MLKFSILGRVIPMSDGRCPWIWFSPTSNTFNEDKLKIEGGIVPDNLFVLIEKKKCKFRQLAKRMRDTPTQVIRICKKHY